MNRFLSIALALFAFAASGAIVAVEWDAVAEAAFYNVYCNSNKVASTPYLAAKIELNLPGEYVFYSTTVDTNGIESNPSNTVTAALYRTSMVWNVPTNQLTNQISYNIRQCPPDFPPPKPFTWPIITNVPAPFAELVEQSTQLRQVSWTNAVTGLEGNEGIGPVQQIFYRE